MSDRRQTKRSSPLRESFFVSYALGSSEVQWGHLVAAMAISEQQKGHFLVVGAAGAAGFLPMVDVFDRRQMSSNGEFYRPADHHHAVILLLHMQHHMLGEGVGLRHLCDWGCFVNATAGKPFWQKALIPFLREIGLLQYAAVMTGVCQEYFGIHVPDGMPIAEQQLCDGVMEDILSAGNFGAKDSLRKSSGHLVSNRGKDGTGRSPVYYLFANLKATVHENHPITKRWKILYPVFASYRLCRYAWLMMIGKRESMYKALPQAAKRKAIYDELHIFEVTNS